MAERSAAVVLVRHGQTEGFPGGSYTELTELGVRQASAVGAALRALRPAVLAVGPRERQQQTAALAAAAAGWQPATVWPTLDEHMGREVFLYAAERFAEGDPEVEFMDGWDASVPALTAAFRRALLAWSEGRLAPDVEPWREVMSRAAAAVRELGAQAAGELAVGVTSAGFIGAAVGGAVGASPRVAMELSFAVLNASVSGLRVRGDRAQLQRFNEAAHLGGGLQTAV